jgi:hypothetical protein
MMRRNWLAVGFSVALMLQSSALFAQIKSENPAQTGAGEAIVQEQNPVDLNLTWELVPRPPIKFTPFDMVDPNTGKPVKPDDLIEVNGVKMKAGDFYRRLNETERWLNAHGYSLRTDTVFEYYSPELEAQIADSERRLRELEAKMPIEGEPVDRLDNGSDFMPASCSSDARGFDTGWYGNSFYGIRFYGSGGFQACYNNLTATVSGQAVLSGRIANIQANIADATANASGRLVNFYPLTLDYNYAINVRVFGNTVWGPSGSGRIAGSYQNSWNWNILNRRWDSPTIRIACFSLFGIPICIDGQVGANLSINLAASVDIQAFAQTATATPYGSATGWAAAWIGANAGIARAEAGVRGSLNFFNGSLQGTANGNFSVVNNCLRYNLNAQLNASLTALSGTIDAYVRGCIWFFGWQCAEASARLFSWSGISWNRTLGSYSNSYTVFCQ